MTVPDYEWRLRTVMADRGLFSTTSMHQLLKERGITLSASQVYRLVVDRPERLNLSVLMALVDILDCKLDDLIRTVPAVAAPQARKAAQGRRASPGRDADLGLARPRRARIVEPHDERA